MRMKAPSSVFFEDIGLRWSLLEQHTDGSASGLDGLTDGSMLLGAAHGGGGGGKGTKGALTCKRPAIPWAVPPPT